MGLFNFLKTQTLKNIDWTDSTSNTLMFKYPMDGKEIMIGSKLTVRESQIAIFMVKGQIADVFGPGIHTLIVNNLPILSKLLAWPRGFKQAFTADVFFVSTKQFTNQKWGTSNPITMRDKDFGSIRIKSYGTFAFKVEDPVKFLKELFGTNSEFTTDAISAYLKSILVAGISDTIAQSKISALDLAQNLLEFNNLAKNQIAVHFEGLGLNLTNLIIENISFPDDVEKAIDTQSSMGVLKNDMDTFVKYKTAQAIGDIAKNQGVAGLGTQMGAGMAIGEIVKDAMKSNQKQEQKTDENFKFCSECGAKNKLSAKFCEECGAKLATSEKFCAKCGQKLKANAKFCPECGTKV